MDATQPAVPTLVTVREYGGLQHEFKSLQEYADWLIAGMQSGDPDFGVDLREDWHGASEREQEEFEEQILEAIHEAARVR